MNSLSRRGSHFVFCSSMNVKTFIQNRAFFSFRNNPGVIHLDKHFPSIGPFDISRSSQKFLTVFLYLGIAYELLLLFTGGKVSPPVAYRPFSVYRIMSARSRVGPSDAAHRAEWLRELSTVAQRIRTRRETLSQALRRVGQVTTGLPFLVSNLCLFWHHLIYRHIATF